MTNDSELTEDTTDDVASQLGHYRLGDSGIDGMNEIIQKHCSKCVKTP
jgi:hypothetical protein